jgi:hypothetical protein
MQLACRRTLPQDRKASKNKNNNCLPAWQTIFIRTALSGVRLAGERLCMQFKKTDLIAVHCWQVFLYWKDLENSQIRLLASHCFVLVGNLLVIRVSSFLLQVT